MADRGLVERIHALEPKHVAEDVMRATVDLGGEAQRFEIMDRALELGGWSEEELGVLAWWKQAARSTHLRALVDAAVDLCGRRGLLERAGPKGRWRLPGTISAGGGVGSAYRPARRASRRLEDARAIVDLNDLDGRTDEHMALQDDMSSMLRARGIAPLSWRPPEPVYDLAFELGDAVVVVEVKTLGDGGHRQQMRLGVGQLVEYVHRMAEIHNRPVHGALLTSESPDEAWRGVLDSVGIVLVDRAAFPAQLDALVARLSSG